MTKHQTIDRHVVTAAVKQRSSSSSSAAAAALRSSVISETDSRRHGCCSDTEARFPLAELTGRQIGSGNRALNCRQSQSAAGCALAHCHMASSPLAARLLEWLTDIPEDLLAIIGLI